MRFIVAKRTLLSTALAAAAVITPLSAYSADPSMMSGSRSNIVIVHGGTGIGNYGQWDYRATGSQNAVAVGARAYATIDEGAAKTYEKWYVGSTFNVAVGADATAFGEQSLAVGGKAAAGNKNGTETQSTAVGYMANANDKSTAIGAESRVQRATGVALGYGSTLSNTKLDETPLTAGHIGGGNSDPVRLTYKNDEGDVSAGGVSVGSKYSTRQIKNVADGTALNDAVTVAQLLDVIAQMNQALAKKADKVGPVQSRSLPLAHTRDELKKLQEDGELLSPQ